MKIAREKDKSRRRPPEFVGTKGAQSLRSGIAFGTLAAVLTRALGFATSILIARALSIDEFGRFAIFLTTFQVASIIASGSLGNTTTRLVASAAPDFKLQGELIAQTFTLATCSGLFFTIAAWCTSATVADAAFPDANMAQAFAIGSIGLLASAMVGVVDGALLGLHFYRQRILLQAIQPIAFLILIILAASLTAIPYAVNIINLYVLSLVCSASIGLYQIRNICQWTHIPKIIIEQRCRALGSHAREAVPMIANALLVVGQNWLALRILANTTNGLGETGAANLGNQLRTAASSLVFNIQSLQSVSFIASANKINVASDVLKSLKISTASSFFLAGALGLCIKAIIFLIGSKYATHEDTLLLAVAILPAISAANLLGIALQMNGLVKLTVKWNLMQLTAAVSITWFLAPAHGALGLLIALQVASVLQSIGLALTCSANRILPFKLQRGTLTLVIAYSLTTSLFAVADEGGRTGSYILAAAALLCSASFILKEAIFKRS